MQRLVIAVLALTVGLAVGHFRQEPSATAGPVLTATENGDVNGDTARDISDAVALLNWLFLGGPEPVDLECSELDAALARIDELEAELLVCQNGPCGGECPPGTICVGGQCIECPPGTSNCGGECVDLFTDPNHCGRCGSSCPPGTTCQAGACVASEDCRHPAEGGTFASAIGATDLIYVARSAVAVHFDDLVLEIYGSQGAPTGAFDFVLSGENYDACSVCVLLRADCVEAEECDKTFLATSGRVIVEENGGVDGLLVGRLLDVELVEVEIDEQTFRSTPVRGGETRCVGVHEFSVNIR